MRNFFDITRKVSYKKYTPSIKHIEVPRMKSKFSLFTTIALLSMTITVSGCNNQQSTQAPPVTTTGETEISFGGDTVEILETPSKTNKTETVQESNTTLFHGSQLRKVDPASQKPPLILKTFKFDGIIRKWINNGYASSLTTVNLDTIDLILGRAEANLVFSNGKWQQTENNIAHRDPGRTARKDNVGRNNTGLFSVSCFTNRPKDTILREECIKIFKENSVTVNDIAKMNIEQLREFYFKNKMPIVLTNVYLKDFKSSAEAMISILQEIGFTNLTFSEYIASLDSANQMGLGGATKLMRIYYDLRDLNRDEILECINTLKVTPKDGIFLTGFGYQINLNQSDLKSVRFGLARLIYSNTLGDKSTFLVAQDNWLNDAAKRWTFGSLVRDYPNLTDEIKAEVNAKNKTVQWEKVKFYATTVSGKAAVEVLEITDVKTTVLFKKQYTPKTNFHEYNSAKVAFGDSIRRFASLPQSVEELNAMVADTPRFLKEYREFYGVK